MPEAQWLTCQKSNCAQLESARVNGVAAARWHWHSKNGPNRSETQKKRANARLTGAHKAVPKRCGVSASALNLQLDLGP